MVTRLLTASGVMMSMALLAAPLSQSMPAGAVAYAEMTGLGQKLQQLRDSDFFKTIMNSPQMEEAKEQENYTKAMAGKAFAEGYLAMDLWTAADKLLSDMAVGVYFVEDGADPAPLMVLRMKDQEVWVKTRERLAPLVLLAGEKVKREVKGELEYLTAENLQVVFHKEWAAASTDAALLEKGIASLTGKAKENVAANSSFQKMEKSMGKGQLLRVWSDLKYYRELIPGGRMNLPEKYDDGFVSLVLSGIMELALKSDYVGLTLDVDDKGLKLNTGIDGKAAALGEKFGWFFSDPTKPGTKDVPAVKGLLGGMTIHRDIADWYDRREELMVEDLQAGFDQFESGVGNLFPGRDVGQDIIPAFGKSITLLAAEQTFDHLDGAPGIKLPGFAVIFDLNNPEDGAMFQLLYQTVVTILNFAGAEDGNNMREPSVMTALVHNGTPINTVQYLKKPKGDRLDVTYNFMPASATVNGRYVFCSSLSLCKALVDQMKKPQDMKRANRNFNFELRPSAMVGLVKQNRRTLLAKSIQQGKPAVQARQEIKVLEDVLEFVKLIRFNTAVKPDGFQLQFNTQWN